MCGIAGIISRNKIDFSQEIKQMTDALYHRGPDSEGYFIDRISGIYLGHRRLSIIDTSSAGQQPMENERKEIVLVYNGEIYNYLDLQKELISKGHRFISYTDTEVVIHAYEEWGMQCLQKLNGMFSFFLLDIPRKKGFLVRDPFGIKPCYYEFTKDLFIFASEAKAFYALRNTVWEPEFLEDNLRILISFQFLYKNDQTVFRNLQRLKPAHYLEFDYMNFKKSEKQYTSLETTQEYGNVSFYDAVKLTKQKLLASVNFQLNADVPVGILLSGGLDSSLIAALASSVKGDRVNTFTASFDHKLDETKYANIVSCHLSTKHINIPIDPKEINKRIEEIIPYFDDMSCIDGGLFTVFLLSEKIKNYGIKVLLVGEGADEVFGGYSWFGLSRLPFKFIPFRFRVRLHHYAVSRMILGEDVNRTFKEMFDIIKDFCEKDIFRQVSRWEIMSQLPNNYLMKIDRATMAHGIEARVPYLDKEVVEFVYSLPAKYKYKGTFFNFNSVNEKFLLREVAVDCLPVNIYTRKKRGFSIPLAEVLKSDQDKVRDYIFQENSISRSFFSIGTLRKLVNFKDSMYHPLEKEKEFLLWKLFLLEVWKAKVLS